MSEENIKRYTIDEIDEMIERGESQTNWERLRAMTDDEIDAAIAADPDWQEMKDLVWSDPVWVVPNVTPSVSIRLDPEVLAFFKKDGPGYRSRINDALRTYVENAQKAAE